MSSCRENFSGDGTWIHRRIFTVIVRACLGIAMSIGALYAMSIKHFSSPAEGSEKGGILLFSQSQIEKAVVNYESIAFIEIVSFKEEHSGTRSYQTKYTVKVLASTTKWGLMRKDLWHYGQPQLKGTHFIVIVPPGGWVAHHEQWAIPVSEKNGMELYDAHKKIVDSIKRQILPNDVLREVKKGNLSLLLAKADEGVVQENEGDSHVTSTLYSLKTIKVVKGIIYGWVKVRLIGSRPLNGGHTFLLAVSTNTDNPQKANALEVSPESMEKISRLNSERVDVLADASAPIYVDPEGD
jgi:hypothetical protein